MENIDSWLEQFTHGWKMHDIDKVLSLFTKDVEYWETPFSKLTNATVLKSEWEYIKNQKEIDISCTVFSKEDDKYTIIWELKYTSLESKKVHMRGIYLMKLNSENKCTYFFHCGEAPSCCSM